MAYLGVLAAAGINCFLIYYLSIFAGISGPGAIETVRFYAFSWIAAVTFVALVLCAFRWRLTALWMAVGALPLAYWIMRVVAGSP